MGQQVSGARPGGRVAIGRLGLFGVLVGPVVLFVLAVGAVPFHFDGSGPTPVERTIPAYVLAFAGIVVQLASAIAIWVLAGRTRRQATVSAGIVMWIVVSVLLVLCSLIVAGQMLGLLSVEQLLRGQ